MFPTRCFNHIKGVYYFVIFYRFLPPGSYLDAHALGPKVLARSMNEIINDKEKYYDFFRWHNYYSFHEPNETAETDEICAFCAYLNDEKHKHDTTVYNHTRILDFWSCHLNV